MKYLLLTRNPEMGGTSSSAVETPKETPESSAKVEKQEVVKQTGNKLDVLKNIIASDAAMKIALAQADSTLLALVKEKIPTEKQDAAMKELSPLLENLNKITLGFRLKTFKTSVLEKVSAWTGGERPTGKLAEGVQKASSLLGSLEGVGDALTSVSAVTSQFDNVSAMFGGWEDEEPTVSWVKMQIAAIQSKMEEYKAQPGATPAWYRSALLAQLNSVITSDEYKWTAIVLGGSKDNLWWTWDVALSSDIPSITSREPLTPSATESDDEVITYDGYEIDDEYDPTIVDEKTKEDFEKMKPSDKKILDQMRAFPIYRGKMSYCAESARKELHKYFDITPPAWGSAMAVMANYGKLTEAQQQEKNIVSMVDAYPENHKDLKGNVFEIFTHSKGHPDLGHAIRWFRSYPSGKIYVTEWYVKWVPHDKPIPLEEYQEKVGKGMWRKILKIVWFDTKIQVADSEEAFAALQNKNTTQTQMTAIAGGKSKKAAA